MTASQEMLICRVAGDLARVLKERGIKQCDAARRLGVSDVEISHRLGGYRNLTLASICELADLADCVVDVRFKPRPTDDFSIPSQGTAQEK